MILFIWSAVTYSGNDGSSRTTPISCFVAEKNLELIKEENLKKVEQYLEKAVKLSRTCGLTKDDLIDMIKIIGKDE